MATGIFNASYNDYGAEASGVRATIAELTPANLAAQEAAATAFLAGITGITRGLLIKHEISNLTVVNANPKAQATSPEAQREEKWLVRYHENTGGKPHRMEIPNALMTKLDPNNRGFALMTDADVIAFVSAFEAFVKTDAGLGVTVDSIQHKGANT